MYKFVVGFFLAAQDYYLVYMNELHSIWSGQLYLAS